MSKLLEPPYAIMINVPEAFFKHNGKIKGDREEAFRRFYENMGHAAFEHDCFYHFISSIPKHEVQFVYVCFRGYVQYKALLVQFLKNQPVNLPGYSHPARDWCVTTGPVVKAPKGEFPQKGFQGFRYSEQLF